jgi:apolipoprotein N-acyltransferase
LLRALAPLPTLLSRPVFFWPAFAIALSGLVWLLDARAWRRKPKWAAFWRVFAFGFAYYLVGMHWIAWAFLVDPGCACHLHLDAADRAAGRSGHVARRLCETSASASGSPVPRA